MYIRNKVGPRTEPWGTPDVTASVVDPLVPAGQEILDPDYNAGVDIWEAFEIIH